MELEAHFGGDEAEHPLRVGRGHPQIGAGHAVADALDPDGAVGVEHDFDDEVVGQEGGEGAEGGAEHEGAAGLGFARDFGGRHPSRSPSGRRAPG